LKERRGARHGAGCALVLGAVTVGIAACTGDRILLGSGPSEGGAASPGATFGAPAIVSGLGADGADDDKPTLTSDRLEIYFLSTRDGGPGGGDVWKSTRSDVSSVWAAPSLVAEVSSASHEKSPAVSGDGLTLWVASDRDGGQGGLDIYVSTRDDRASPWSTPTVVPALNSKGDEIPRPPGQGGLVMPLAVRPPSATEYQIAFSGRTTPTSEWASPTMLTEIDTADTDVDGFLGADGLVLHFSSDRLNQGDQDLFVASRAGTGAPFGGIAPIPELNSPHDDRDPWLAPDGSEIFFSSDRSGSLKIYRAARIGAPL
jgi:Tol biopolymer transport system component